MKLQAIVHAALLSIAGLVLAACTVTESDAARVDCGTPGPHGVDCQVKRTAGSGAFQACWDLVITCRNEGVMTGSACHAMAAGASEGSENMPVAGFSNQERCNAPASGSVERLEITRK